MLGWICPLLFVLFCIAAIAFQETFVEKLFVALVLLGLFALATRFVWPKVKVSRDLERLEMALASFHHDCGRYPSVSEGLRALREKPEDCEAWSPYLESEEVLEDSWGREFEYHCSESEAELDCHVLSRGPDPEDDEDDIVVTVTR